MLNYCVYLSVSQVSLLGSAANRCRLWKEATGQEGNESQWPEVKFLSVYWWTDDHSSLMMNRMASVVTICMDVRINLNTDHAEALCIRNITLSFESTRKRHYSKVTACKSASLSSLEASGWCDQPWARLSHRGTHWKSLLKIASVPPVPVPAHCMLILIQLPEDLGDCSENRTWATVSFDPDPSCWGLKPACFSALV